MELVSVFGPFCFVSITGGNHPVQFPLPIPLRMGGFLCSQAEEERILCVPEYEEVRETLSYEHSMQYTA